MALLIDVEPRGGIQHAAGLELLGASTRCLVDAGRHLNVLGHYSFTPLTAGSGLRPLRDPEVGGDEDE